jgi:hypothetical protein
MECLALGVVLALVWTLVAGYWQWHPPRRWPPWK